jgi:hypothetical protein
MNYHYYLRREQFLGAELGGGGSRLLLSACLSYCLEYLGNRSVEEDRNMLTKFGQSSRYISSQLALSAVQCRVEEPE